MYIPLNNKSNYTLLSSLIKISAQFWADIFWFCDQFDILVVYNYIKQSTKSLILA